MMPAQSRGRTKMTQIGRVDTDRIRADLPNLRHPRSISTIGGAQSFGIEVDNDLITSVSRSAVKAP